MFYVIFKTLWWGGRIEENKTEIKQPENPSLEDFKKKLKEKDGVDQEKLIKQIATRDKLERDYEEDILSVEFYSSPETKRMVKAKRPTQVQMMTIMKLSAEAALYEGRGDASSMDKMVSIYDKLPELAATLCVDRMLNKDFWSNKVSFSTLQNFITELIKETQKGTGVPGEEMKSFRS